VNETRHFRATCGCTYSFVHSVIEGQTYGFTV